VSSLQPIPGASPGVPGSDLGAGHVGGRREHRGPRRGRRTLSRLARALGLLAVALAAIGLGAGLWLHHRLTAALPQTSGRLAVAGLVAEAAIERDALGIPTIRGASRRDVAFATGFVHAQDRYFQMDLLRRRAAGELAELFGPAALPGDRAMRIHLFRARAGRVLAASAPQAREVIAAYAAGVNAGLGALAAPPFEYLVLRVPPRPWRAEDSVLALFTMFAQLEDVNGETESALTLMHDRLPAGLFRFLDPAATEWEAPLAGTPPAAAPPPGPEVFDLRAPRAAAALPPEGASGIGPVSMDRRPGGGEGWQPGARRLASNCWAVAARLTASGGALLANELHLGLGVPNVWYRAMLTWPAEAPGMAPHRVVGATLPGTPAVVVGSNGEVAWGVTNSVLDTSDLVLLEIDPRDPGRYRTPQGWRRFEHHPEVLAVKGRPARKTVVDWTVWGPVADEDQRGSKRAVRAAVDEEGAADFAVLGLETASGVEQALDVARRSGLPALNFIAADRTGRIGWTIAGRLPRRAGFDGEIASSWADGKRRWQGLVPASEVPRLVDPPSGRLWTANNLVLAGEAAAPLGRGNFVLGARARQIRDDLFALRLATVEDMRRIQLDDRARFLGRWHDLLLQVLTPRALAADPRRRELRALVEHWGGRAGVGSAGYRIVRTFRRMVAHEVFAPLTAACRAADPEFSYEEEVPRYEGPLWQLLTRRPLHLLDRKFRDWDELLLAAADEVGSLFASQGPRLADRTWGERNTSAIDHPLSGALPLLGRRLSMPPRQLPGDEDMPRVQAPAYGATLRMVVSPGREAEGIFQMPGGESGNPVSEHYADLHDAWAAGAPAPLLPGKTVTILTLAPAPAPAPRGGTG
jgi:penicillin amidase